MKLFLSEENEKFVKESIENLMKKPEEGDFIEWGDIGVKISDIFDEEVIFDVYYIVSMITKKKKLKQKKKKK